MAAAEFQRSFGPLSTPTFYLFSPEGRLTHRLAGEARVDYLLTLLRG